jgi:beta-galactosidase
VSPRQVIDLPATWRFHLGDVPGAQRPAFDDVGWQGVSVPHTWNAADGQDGGNDYLRGSGWYRARFVLPQELAGRKLFLEFGGANQLAEVWLNGQRLGEHRGGYTAFRLEATAVATPELENLLAVRVSNTPDPDILPLSADYTFFGGLYRPVRLLATDRLHVRALDAGGPGAYVRPTQVTAAGADLAVAVSLWNSFPDSRRVIVRTVLVDAAGEVALSLATTHTVPAEAGLDVAQRGHLATPHLWQGRMDPYLYTAHVVVDDGGTVRDRVSLPVGFRSLRVDPVRGFLLNGQPYPLRGVNRHQDRQDLGWALGEAEHDEDFRLITELGANAVRLAHYPQDPYVYDLADRLGLVLWSEIPFINRAGDSPAFASNARQQLIEMIRQHAAHPSVAIWGLGNEVTLDPTGPDPNPLLRELAALAKTEDPSRLTAVAHCCTPDAGPELRHSDVVGYNHYSGWYGADLAEMGPWADALHAAEPDLAIALSEYGAGASTRHHQERPVLPDPSGRFHPEEYQALVHETLWPVIASRPFLWGSFVWNMFDFASDGRAEGERSGRNDKGLVSYDRRTKKDAYWYYRAAWSDESVVYLTGRRFEPRTASDITVKVYANSDTVRLTVNGADLGTHSVHNHVASWPAVPLAIGSNTVVAEGGAGDRARRDEVVWTRVPLRRLVLPRVQAR